MKNKNSLMTKVSNRKKRITAYAAAMCAVVLSNIVPAYATGTTVNSVVNKLIDIIGNIFVAIGVILLVYSVGQLVLAFKNEDPDSKSKATTILVVSAVLISFPSIIKTLGLDQIVKF